MGLLTEGQPLTWEETKRLADHVRQHGVDQFLNLYHQLLDRKGDVLKWGDEVTIYNAPVNNSQAIRFNIATLAFATYVDIYPF